MFGLWEGKPKRETPDGVKRKQILFTCEPQVANQGGNCLVSLDLHQAASHMGDSLGEVTGGTDLVDDG